MPLQLLHLINLLLSLSIIQISTRIFCLKINLIFHFLYRKLLRINISLLILLILLFRFSVLYISVFPRKIMFSLFIINVFNIISLISLIYELLFIWLSNEFIGSFLMFFVMIVLIR